VQFVLFTKGCYFWSLNDTLHPAIQRIQKIKTGR
jgi:hypothetical protein